MSECNLPGNQQVAGNNPGSLNNPQTGLKINTDSANIFNPNNLLSSVQTYLSLNNAANKMFGIEARWFRAVPQQRSKDVIFQTYTLSNVEDTPVCLKVMVKDGQLPDNNYQYDLMGLEYNIPTTLEIDKKYWEELAGFGTAPQKKDIVYLVMPNKLYQVESSYLKRGYMEQETTWVVNLVKYQPEASRKEGPNLKETIDNYTVSEAELFGQMLQDDVERLVDKKQMSPMNSTSQDKYKELDLALKILPSRVRIGSITVADSIYDLGTSSLFNAIRYKNGDSISPTSDRSLLSWINIKKNINKEYEVVWMQPDVALTPPANYKIKIKGAQQFKIGDKFYIWRSEKMSIYAKVIDTAYSAAGIYWVQIDSDVISIMNSIMANWWERPNWKMKLSSSVSLLDGINVSTTGLSAEINGNQYIKIIYASQQYIFNLPNKLREDKWYGIVINLGNSWSQLNINLWEPEDIEKTDRLRNTFSETISILPEGVEVESYTINKSETLMTNIRLFDCTIEYEKQENELLSYFTKNADNGIILDNADLKFTAPYISRQR